MQELSVERQGGRAVRSAPPSQDAAARHDDHNEATPETEMKILQVMLTFGLCVVCF